MSTTNLEPFDLAAALAGRKTVTRDRKRVLAIWDSGLDRLYPVGAFIEGISTVRTFSRQGVLVVGRESDLDFFHPPAWRLPDPPPGMKWHRDDWTEEMLPDVTDGGLPWRPVLHGEDEQPGDEEQVGFDWIACKTPVSQLSGYYNRTRTRRPLPPAKKRVPLGPEDVPPRSVFRREEWNSGDGAPYVAPSVWCWGIAYAGRDSHTVSTWDELLEQGWEILRPGAEWQPCWKGVDA